MSNEFIIKLNGEMRDGKREGASCGNEKTPGRMMQEPEGAEKVVRNVESMIQTYPLRENDFWYLVDYRWYLRWKSEWPSAPGTIGEIENKSLVDENGSVKNNLMENHDYILMPQSCWNRIRSFGFDVEIKRKVISTESGLLIEVHPVDLVIENGLNRNVNMRLSVSRITRVEQIKAPIMAQFQLSGKCYMMMVEEGEIIAIDESKTFEQLSIMSAVLVIVPQTEENKIKPFKIQEPVGYKRKGSSSGLVGLQNLGNTCFMNSALQCLSNTELLTEYFISGKYLNEINTENPLGMKGEIAGAYGQLIKEMWTTDEAVSPRHFKFTISRFAHQFSGYQQHDSQELLSFLMDGLHEDLNRIKKKPYVEIKDDDTRDENIIADEMWQLHKKRNDSIIVDLFQGQFKSTLVCPQCGYVSVTFDPFMYLSLPLPSTSQSTIQLTFVFKNKTPIKFSVKIPKNSFIQDLKEAISEKVDLATSKIFVADVYCSKIHSTFEDKRRLHITPNDTIFAYEVDDEEGIVQIPIYFKAPKKEYSYSEDLFGEPLVISLPSVISQSKLLNLIKEKVSPFLVAPKGFNIGLKEPYGPCIEIKESEENDLNFSSSHTLILQIKQDQEFSFLLNPTQVTEDHQDSSSPKADLGTCLDLFTRTEKLSQDDPWYCKKCKKHQQATKKFDLWRLPEFLVVHLKRFSYNRFFRDKIDTFIDYPIEGLSLAKYVKGPSRNGIYDL
ncbi:cysteine proteinase, partial [Rozella allomycis CSF55]